jgi:integrase
MSKQIQLQNGCSASIPAVTPSNWKTGGKELLKKDWRIQYYFKDPRFPKVKQVRKKGMNEYKTLQERRYATQFILDEIHKILKFENFNPITGLNMNGNINVNPHTLFPLALEYAFKNYKASKNRILNVRSTLKYINQSIVRVGLEHVPINQITRRNIKDILRNQEQMRGISEDRYNKYLSMLSPLFDILIEDEVIENNPTLKIKKYTITREPREILTEQEKIEVSNHLHENFYSFWRFMVIFIYSGAREVELLRVKVKDVDLKKLEYKVLIKKGRLNVIVTKPINKHISYLWKELINELKIVDNRKVFSHPNDCIFSKGLVWGEKSISRAQITRRWKVHVKDKLGVTADFYAFKHAYLDKVSEVLTLKDAQKLASHTSDKMLRKHYAIGEEQRQMDRLKDIEIPFFEDKIEKSMKIV